jgi:hypothetical protein
LIACSTITRHLLYDTILQNLSSFDSDSGGSHSRGEIGYLNRSRLLQNAARDAEKLEQPLKIKERQKEETMHMEDTQRLVAEEIEMLKVVLH